MCAGISSRNLTRRRFLLGIGGLAIASGQYRNPYVVSYAPHGDNADISYWLFRDGELISYWIAPDPPPQSDAAHPSSP